jgi:hypothetical protein
LALILKDHLTQAGISKIMTRQVFPIGAYENRIRLKTSQQMTTNPYLTTIKEGESWDY